MSTFNSHQSRIGGIGKIVEIDESKFRERKYNRGHKVEGQWVFGGYERVTGRIFMVAVDSRYVFFIFFYCYIKIL